MIHAGQIERQSVSYRQGLVLGLTMAEIMLLLVFCLLLAAGATLRHEQQQRANVERQVAELKNDAWGGRTERDRVEREIASLKDTLAKEKSARERAERDAELITGSLKGERNAREKAQKEVETLTKAAALGEAITAITMKDVALTEDLKEASRSETAITDLWTEIVESREVTRKLKNVGITPADVKENATFLSAAMEERRRGAEAADLKRQAELAQGVAKVEKANGIEIADVSRTLEALDKGLKADAKGDDPNGHRWPPMISLSEADGFFFKLGSAELSPEFDDRLKEVVVPALLKTAKDFDVNVIEVVGHTDELPIGVRSSNLDREMIHVMRGDKPIGALRPGDNAGLGLARSVSVVKELLQDPRLAGLRILPMSGAQLIKTDETLADDTEQGDVKKRRRIEIRLRKQTQAQAVQSSAP